MRPQPTRTTISITLAIAVATLLTIAFCPDDPASTFWRVCGLAMLIGAVVWAIYLIRKILYDRQTNREIGRTIGF